MNKEILWVLSSGQFRARGKDRAGGVKKIFITEY